MELEMIDLEMMRYFLDFEIKQKKSGVFLSQGAYVCEILQKFRMNDYNLIVTPMRLSVKFSKLKREEVVDSNTYQSIIESLMYMTCTRSKITFIVEVVSRFMEDLEYPHLKVVNRILIYV
jgi:protein associated with RNAse G/E